MRIRKNLLLILLDILAIVSSYTLAIFLRFEGDVPWNLFNISIYNVIVIIGVKLTMYYLFKLYASIWKYASIDELLKVIIATIIANIITTVYIYSFNIFFPRSLIIIVPILDIFLIGGSRFTIRAMRRLESGIGIISNTNRVIIVGAGSAGVLTLKEIRNHRELYSRPVGFVDDDPDKIGKSINGIPVLGNIDDINWICKRYNIDEIIIALPSTKQEDIKDIINKCNKTHCKTKILPGVYELLDGKVNVSSIREVEIEDLLGREVVDLDLEELSDFIKDKRVMITGGGGSIGSELCRQIANYFPSSLMILDTNENSVYDLQNELRKDYPSLNLKTFISSIKDMKLIDEIMENEKPEIVFHAAAHKHVPLMEANPKSAIKNNVFGTLNIVQASDKHKVDKFVMISTDKAVNPTNVMGATKRICEMIIQGFNTCSDTDYVAVRFGNVLGSNGSVIPLFKKQIKEGGPVTVTDKEVIRYFMTIPEACQLVLQAGSMATGGEIFILDMGEPVKILDLAKDLIRLSGFKPNIDIAIEFIGLRPGEKLYEELILNKDETTETPYEKIYIEKPMSFKYNDIIEYTNLLEKALESNSKEYIRDILQLIVPSYNPYVPEDISDRKVELHKIEKEDSTIEEYV